MTEPSPWNDATKSITGDAKLAEAFTEEQKLEINTVSPLSTYIRSNVSLTNGESLDSPTLETIPNLYQAVKVAFDFAVEGRSSDFGPNGIKTDQISFSTETDGDVVLVLNDSATTTANRYSFKKIIDAINTLDQRTQHLISQENDKTIEILVDDPEPEPEPEPQP